MKDISKRNEYAEYSRLMQTRVLTDVAYKKYLDRKQRCKAFHKSLLDSVINFDKVMIDSDYYDPNYSDLLLFSIVPDRYQRKVWGFIR